VLIHSLEIKELAWMRNTMHHDPEFCLVANQSGACDTVLPIVIKGKLCPKLLFVLASF